MGKPGMAGGYTNQRLSLSKPWKGLRMICQGFKPDPGNLAVRHYRGASRNVRHGETVNPSCNRKSGNGNPSPTAGRARSLSQQQGRRASQLARTTLLRDGPTLMATGQHFRLYVEQQFQRWFWIQRFHNIWPALPAGKRANRLPWDQIKRRCEGFPWVPLVGRRRPSGR